MFEVDFKCSNDSYGIWLKNRGCVWWKKTEILFNLAVE